MQYCTGEHQRQLTSAANVGLRCSILCPCSNRSAALLKLKKVTKALEDADACIKLKPDWEKGYFRKASVFEEQQAFDKVCMEIQISCFIETSCMKFDKVQHCIAGI